MSVLTILMTIIFAHVTFATYQADVLNTALPEGATIVAAELQLADQTLSSSLIIGGDGEGADRWVMQFAYDGQIENQTPIDGIVFQIDCQGTLINSELQIVIPPFYSYGPLFPQTFAEVGFDLQMDCTTAVGDKQKMPELPLLNSFPNPFNPTATLQFSLPRATNAILDVYNINGQKIRRLRSGVLQAGDHEFVFNGDGLASGIYLVSLQAGQLEVWTRALLLK
jgi:hypothetical protein